MFVMKFEEIFDDFSQRATKTMCVHMAEEADVKDREKNSNCITNTEAGLLKNHGVLCNC